jgi:hypothetical protein
MEVFMDRILALIKAVDATRRYSLTSRDIPSLHHYSGGFAFKVSAIIGNKLYGNINLVVNILRGSPEPLVGDSNVFNQTITMSSAEPLICGAEPAAQAAQSNVTEANKGGVGHN